MFSHDGVLAWRLCTPSRSSVEGANFIVITKNVYLSIGDLDKRPSDV